MIAALGTYGLYIAGYALLAASSIASVFTAFVLSIYRYQIISRLSNRLKTAYAAFKQAYFDRAEKQQDPILDLIPYREGHKAVVHPTPKSYLGQLFDWVDKQQAAFKTKMVKLMGPETILSLAAVFPIGSWLEYEERDRYGYTILLEALDKREIKKIDMILSRASKKAIYRYYAMKDCLRLGCIESTLDISDPQPELFRKLVEAILPEHRWALLSSLKYRDSRLFEEFVQDYAEPHFHILMELLPVKDRLVAFETMNDHGENLFYQLINQMPSRKKLDAYLQYCPKETLLSLLLTPTGGGNTPLIRSAWSGRHPMTNQFFKNDDGLEYILNAVPKKEMKAFLAHLDQGNTAMLFAFHTENTRKQKLLTKAGVKMTTLTKEAAKEAVEQLLDRLEVYGRIRESSKKLKEQTGESLFEILDLPENTTNLNDIKRRYREKILQHHPDRSKEKDAAEKTRKIQYAYNLHRDQTLWSQNNDFDFDLKTDFDANAFSFK